MRSLGRNRGWPDTSSGYWTHRYSGHTFRSWELGVGLEIRPLAVHDANTRFWPEELSWPSSDLQGPLTPQFTPEGGLRSPASSRTLSSGFSLSPKRQTTISYPVSLTPHFPTILTPSIFHFSPSGAALPTRTLTLGARPAQNISFFYLASLRFAWAKEKLYFLCPSPTKDYAINITRCRRGSDRGENLVALRALWYVNHNSRDAKWSVYRIVFYPSLTFWRENIPFSQPVPSRGYHGLNKASELRLI